jgi:hypothetical protein
MDRELVDCTGRRRSPAAMPGHYAGHSPPNKGRRYPADPPTVEEIVRVMRAAGPGAIGVARDDRRAVALGTANQ